MNAFNANLFAYIFPALVFVAVACYYTYGAIDRIGLPTREVEGIVTGKQFTPGSTTYNSNVVAGQNYVQAQQQPDYYAVSVRIQDTPSVALVDRATYAAVQVNERVHLKIQRTRITGRLVVVELRR
jgi:hypothetical protein